MSDIDNKQLNINGTDSSENSLDWTDKLRYSKSFVAKLALSDESVKRYYAAIASKLLAYNRVRSRTRWNGVSFAEGRTVFARLTITGKTLCLYLAVEPSTVADGKYRAKDVFTSESTKKRLRFSVFAATARLTTLCALSTA